MSYPSELVQSDEGAAGALRVCLLGPPRVVWADRFLVIRRRQVRALLYYLATVRQAVPREHLCGLFWADVPEATARRNLTALLTHLRHDLPVPDVLLTTGDLVELDRNGFWADAEVLAHLCAAVRRGSPARTLQQAIVLYHGPFLAGFSLPGCPEYEAWVTAERQAWEQMFLEALDAVIEEQAARGEHEAAIAAARRYLEIDDLAEDIHRRLIQLYGDIGNRSAARSQFNRCVAMLERDLGVHPLPETVAAYRAALSGTQPT